MIRYRPSWLRLPTEYADTHVEVSPCAAAGTMLQCPSFYQVHTVHCQSLAVHGAGLS